MFSSLIVLALAAAPQHHAELRQLVDEALRRNPEILAAQKRYEASRQRPAQASALPDPTISFGYNSNGNPLPGAGLGTYPTSNIGVMYSQEIPDPGKRRLRARIASSEADADLERYRATELSVVSRLKQAWFRYEHSFAGRAVLEANLDLLRNLLSVTEARYSVGKAAQQDVFKAQVQISVLQTRVLQLDRENRTLRAEINGLLDRSPDAPIANPPEPQPGDVDFTIEQLEATAADKAPSLAYRQKLLEGAESGLSLARRNRYPELTLNAGYFNMGSMPAMYLFRADLKIPIWGRKERAEVTENAAVVAAARHDYEGAVETLRVRIRDEYATAETSARLMKIYSETIIPQARFAIESSLASYQTGYVDFSSVLANHVAVLDYQMNYHQEMENYHLALARLEELTGVELVH